MEDTEKLLEDNLRRLFQTMVRRYHEIIDGRRGSDLELPSGTLEDQTKRDPDGRVLKKISIELPSIDPETHANRVEALRKWSGTFFPYQTTDLREYKPGFWFYRDRTLLTLQEDAAHQYIERDRSKRMGFARLEHMGIFDNVSVRLTSKTVMVLAALVEEVHLLRRTIEECEVEIPVPYPEEKR